MKALKMFTGILMIGILMMSCENNNKDAVSKSLDEADEYIDSVSNLQNEYTSASWSAIDREYQSMISNVKQPGRELTEEERKDFDEINMKYDNLKQKYQAEINKSAEKADMNNPKKQLRDALFGEGKIGNDMQFSFVTADNILSVYERFVNTVAANQNNYSREDWDEIKVLYEALDSRKNEVEKNLDGKDNRKIAGLKVKFSAIKSVKRPLAKVKENEDAKQ